MEQTQLPTHELPIATTPAPPCPWAPKAIIFDLLTALLDSWTLWDISAGSTENGRKWRNRYLELTFGCGAYKPYEDIVKQAAREVDLDTKAAEALIARWNQLQPWPEAKKVVEKLKQKGYKLGVVTNCSKRLGRRAASVVGLWDAVVAAEEAGFYKPHAAAYDAILAALEVRPEEALFVAGSSGDVIGASEAGMKVVWNNHVGLTAPLGSTSNPLKEGNSLDETLADFL